LLSCWDEAIEVYGQVAKLSEHDHGDGCHFTIWMDCGDDTVAILQHPICDGYGRPWREFRFFRYSEASGVLGGL
jgi:hypothetical protein